MSEVTGRFLTKAETKALVKARTEDWLKASRELTTLDEVFEWITWESKFEYNVPDSHIVEVFRPRDVAAAIRYFVRHKEETAMVGRSVSLGHDSSGPVLCVTEEKLAECP